MKKNKLINNLVDNCRSGFKTNIISYDLSLCLAPFSKVNFLKNKKFLAYEVNNGKVHYVYKILLDNDIYYLKIRKSHFFSNKSIKINPKDIKREYKALNILNSITNIGPEIVEFSYSYNYILLKGLNKYMSFLNLIQGVKTDTIVNIANYLVNFHKKLKYNSREEVLIGTKMEENKIYEDLIYYRLGFLKNEYVDKLIKKLKDNKNGLIHGDLTPNNIFVTDNSVKFIDFETVHFGNQEFDIGFFLAHLILFNLSNKDLLDLLYTFDKIIKDANSYDINFIYKIIAGIVLYRVESDFSYTFLSFKKEELIKFANYILRQKFTDSNSFYVALSKLIGS